MTGFLLALQYYYTIIEITMLLGIKLYLSSENYPYCSTMNKFIFFLLCFCLLADCCYGSKVSQSSSEPSVQPSPQPSSQPTLRPGVTAPEFDQCNTQCTLHAPLMVGPPGRDGRDGSPGIGGPMME